MYNKYNKMMLQLMFVESKMLPAEAYSFVHINQQVRILKQQIYQYKH